MNQEYKIVEFRLSLPDQDKSVFLPVGVQILEVYYEVVSIDNSWIASIGSIDRLLRFNYIKHLLNQVDFDLSFYDDRVRIEALLNDYGMANIPLNCFDGDVRMVIKALVPAPKPKGKYA